MIRHKAVSAVPDLASPAGRVKPSDWNDTHNAPPFVVPLVNASVTWSNMPAAATEFTGLPRTKVDLSYVDQVRIVVRVGVVGGLTGTLRLQYSLDESAWVNLTATVGIDSTGTKVSEWEVIPAGAKADVFIRIQGTGTLGTEDPQFRLVQLQVR